MKPQAIPDELFSYLMDRVTGTRFETFAKRIFGAHFGEAFTPLGGIHDGGADGALSSYVQEVQGKANTFIQFSTTDPAGAKGKIVDTIDALRKAGRAPMQVIYATNRALPKSDLIVQEIYDNQSVMVQIRDVERIKHYLAEPSAAGVFQETFFPEISNLARASDLNLPVVSRFSSDPTVYVYLNHELRDRFTRDHLNERVLDALIYWALRDTDPDSERFVRRPEIATAISNAFPPAKSVLLPNLNARLNELSKKDAAGQERLRHYRSEDKFCLPFEMRRALAAEASGAILNQERFCASICERLKEEVGELSGSPEKICMELVFATVHRYFIEQGLLLAAFLEGKLEKAQVSDQIVEDIMAQALSEIEHGRSLSPVLVGACLSVLRGIFYQASTDERGYMAYLSRTSCLLVTLQSAPRLLEYFNQMAGNFRLLVGTDLLLKAISEQFLEPERQQVANLLRVCKQLGAELVLTEPVLNEVFTHLHATDLEFRNYYAAQEQYFKPSDISDCDRILIRAYLHARKSPGGPKSWQGYINQLTNPEGLRARSAGARDALGGLLRQRFSMTYMSTDDLEEAVPEDAVGELAKKLDEARQVKHEELSYNDALMTYSVYAQRRKAGESGIYDGFGFRTWWLTKETRVAGLTAELVRAEGVPYIMRPEFILNFVALAPRAADVRKSFAELLPTTAGLQLGRHLSAQTMHELLRDAVEWAGLTPERIGVLLSEKANRLKYDRFKQYTHNIART